MRDPSPPLAWYPWSQSAPAGGCLVSAGGQRADSLGHLLHGDGVRVRLLDNFQHLGLCELHLAIGVTLLRRYWNTATDTSAAIYGNWVTAAGTRLRKVVWLITEHNQHMRV